MKTTKEMKAFVRNYYFNSMKPSPYFIDDYISDNFIYNRIGHFHPHYREWTMRRINKILQIFDLDDFIDKKVLILGDGIGNFGQFFASIGSKVTILEGRTFNINFARLRAVRQLFKHEIIIHKFDLNKDFTKFGKFDFIINFGLVEMIDDPIILLSCCSKMSDVIILETLVSDSLDKEFVGHKKFNPDFIDSGLTDTVSRPSPYWIESFFVNRGFLVSEYFDKDLNTPSHIYDWIPNFDNSMDEIRRRFWVFWRK